MIPRRGSFIFFRRDDLQRQLVHRVYARARIEPGVSGAAGDDQFGGAHAFARGFQLPVTARRRLETSTASLRRASRSIAARDAGCRSLHRSSRKTPGACPAGKRSLRQCVDGGQRQHQTRLHIKCSRTPGASASNAEGHRRQRAERIHRIQVAEYHDLALGPPLAEPDFGAHVISARGMAQNADLRPAPPPFVRDKRAQAIYRGLLVARRFATNKLPEQLDHRARPWPQSPQQSSHHQRIFVHRARILSAATHGSNAAKGGQALSVLSERTSFAGPNTLVLETMTLRYGSGTGGRETA